MRTKKADDPIICGITDKFKPISGSESYREKFITTCRRFEVEIDVIIEHGSFGKDNEFTTNILRTSKVDVSDKLFMGGWGSYCFIDEGEAMRNVARQFAEKHGFTICQEINHWPFYQAVIMSKYELEENGDYKKSKDGNFIQIPFEEKINNLKNLKKNKQYEQRNN
jgi:hypothetical protein